MGRNKENFFNDPQKQAGKNQTLEYKEVLKPICINSSQYLLNGGKQKGIQSYMTFNIECAILFFVSNSNQGNRNKLAYRQRQVPN